MTKKQKIIIVGAGIVGASIAYNLSKKNQDVTLVESHSKAGCGVTSTSFAWINPSGRVPDTFQHLYDGSLAEYHVLEKEIPELKVDWNGSLSWGIPVNIHKSYIETITRQQISDLEPHLKEYPKEALYAFKEGAIDPNILTNLLVKKAQENGVNILFDTKVTQIKKEDAKVVGIHTSKGFIESDVIVLATGTTLPELCKPLSIDVPVEASPSIIIRMKSPRKLIHTLISNSRFEARQLSDTTIIAAEDYLDDHGENGPEEVGRRAFDTLRNDLKKGEYLELESIQVGERPMPKDGYPIVGFHDQIKGLYLAVMHSAITLSPVISRLVAKEIVDNVQLEELEGCRLSRFYPINE
ncbi:FAD-dependent oxidoreductase [Lysinibacillus sp. FSL R7-0073]|uniref:NAD(P)/FAD-dependent oxidoreductase n=1 Tax=Lysinibacillus TaxID=400634 RepID=UPI001881DE17|nr:FAD-dependent oxidoreductase [Lysinibacillus fusiformis]MBD8520501.1 FAD-binding oxidoreductase [Lysinibacillus fusiformis]MED4887486.1 FAD-dependent oxidoreductase [Lysinibacillus fusiformis]